MPRGPLLASPGRLAAALLTGAWRPAPSPPALSGEELSLLAPILHRNGSSGLAWNRIRGSSLEDLSGASLLRDGYRFHTVRVRLIERQLVAVVSFLRDRGVEPILAKGWALGRLYPEPGLRPYGDLDLLVHPGQAPRVKEVLSDPQRPQAPLEVHTGFPMLRDRSPDALLERSELVALSDTPIRILGPEDQLRLACLHGLNHGLCRPLWLCDVAVLLESLPSGFDWGYALRGDPWLSEGVRCSLGLAHEIFGVSLERAGVPDRWRTPPLPGWMVPAAMEAFGASRHYLDMGDPSELMLKPAAFLDAARLRWANPLEATYRREAGWDEKPRFPVQVFDYVSRGLGFVARIPAGLRLGVHLSRERATAGRPPPGGSPPGGAEGRG